MAATSPFPQQGVSYGLKTYSVKRLQDRVLDGFRTLYQDQQLFDVTLRAQTESFNAHRLVATSMH
jgi:hypothetical protein